jgi:hypothetical protein
VAEQVGAVQADVILQVDNITDQAVAAVARRMRERCSRRQWLCSDQRRGQRSPAGGELLQPGAVIYPKRMS